MSDWTRTRLVASRSKASARLAGVEEYVEKMESSRWYRSARSTGRRAPPVGPAKMLILPPGRSRRCICDRTASVTTVSIAPSRPMPPVTPATAGRHVLPCRVDRGADPQAAGQRQAALRDLQDHGDAATRGQDLGDEQAHSAP